MSVIYKIRNVVNGHFYVGSSIKVRTRFQYHRRNLRNGTHHCVPLQRAWAKYGEDAFKFEVIEEVSEADMLAAENVWLGEHYGTPHCYNTGRVAGAAFLGRKHADEAKAKVSAVHKGKQHRLGHTNSPEHRQRISAAMKGKKKSAEHAQKIRTRLIGNTYAKGRVVTDEMRAVFWRPVEEVTQGLQFRSVNEAAAHFGLHHANVIRTIKNGGILKRGPNAGLHFQYLEKHALPQTAE